MRHLVLAAAVLLSSSIVRAQAPAAPAAAPPPAPAPVAKSEPKKATELADLATVKKLCLATRPPERVPFEGDEVARGAARDAYAKTREESMETLFVARFPASAIHLGDYRSKDGRLALDLSRPLRTLHGVLTLALPSEPPLSFEIPEEVAKNVVAAVRSGNARLDVSFELDDDQGAVCSGSAASDVFTVNAAPVVAELRDGLGTVLARAETPLADKHRAAVGGYSGVPAAVVGAVSVEGNGDASSIAKKLSAGVTGPLKQCYAKRLESEPAAGGTVVLGIESEKDGTVSSVSFIANALGDDVLKKCVEDAVKAVRFSGAALFRVPIDLKLVAR